MMAGAGTIYTDKLFFKMILTIMSLNFYMTVDDLTFCDPSY